ncbi:putative RNA pseudouridine synthase YlyB, partial [Lacticaseibacillus paracasei subsp. paracasei Lpp126]
MTSTFTITTEQGRIDKVITAHETTHTRSQVQKMVARWLGDGQWAANQGQ